eukprot:scaffold101519_cov60-Phaeocystis_antarctica.AAC.6
MRIAYSGGVLAPGIVPRVSDYFYLCSGDFFLLDLIRSPARARTVSYLIFQLLYLKSVHARTHHTPPRGPTLGTLGRGPEVCESKVEVLSCGQRRVAPSVRERCQAAAPLGHPFRHTPQRTEATHGVGGVGGVRGAQLA